MSAPQDTTEEQPKLSFQVAFLTREGDSLEGPLALLWKLIESYEVDIFEVSLSRITHDFIAYLKTVEASIEEESEFALMASILLYYKSRQLLPSSGVEIENEPDSLPFELVDQLLEYKKFQMAAEKLRDLEEHNHLSFYRDPQWKDYEDGVDYLEIDMVHFLKVFKEFLVNRDAASVMEIEEEDIPIESMMDEILYRIRVDGKLAFFQYFAKASVMRVVVGFLAILELLRMKKARAFQSTTYGEIEIRPVEVPGLN